MRDWKLFYSFIHNIKSGDGELITQSNMNLSFVYNVSRQFPV